MLRDVLHNRWNLINQSGEIKDKGNAFPISIFFTQWFVIWKRWRERDKAISFITFHSSSSFSRVNHRNEFEQDKFIFAPFIIPMSHKRLFYCNTMKYWLFTRANRFWQWTFPFHQPKHIFIHWKICARSQRRLSKPKTFPPSVRLTRRNTFITCGGARPDERSDWGTRKSV